jgi:8-oxo-dGTP pyrophosphatase MutT (NUDIX family)
MNTTLLWLANEKNEVLLARRNIGMEHNAGTWGLSVTGTMEPGETFNHALLREAKDELGIPTDNLEPVHLHDETYVDTEGELRNFCIFYARIRTDTISTVVLEPAGVAEVRWISVPELKEVYRLHPELIFNSSAKDLWESIFENLEKVLEQN